MLDMPCGDMVWMRHYLEQRMDVDYTGMDIVGSLIDHHKNASGGEHPWRFKQHDIVKDPLQERYDLIFSRQMTQHLGTEDTMQVLHHFSDGGNYLLITNYPGVRVNVPLNAGTAWRFREQNFLIEPYRLIDPIVRVMRMVPMSYLFTDCLCFSGIKPGSNISYNCNISLLNKIIEHSSSSC